MTDDVRLWMVERSYDTRNLITVVYATTDGDRYHRRELSSSMLARTDVTAAIEMPAAELQPIEDERRRERYAAEASRMADSHTPDDVV